MSEETYACYFVVIRRTNTGYSVDVPDLDGCVSTGMTVEHARHMIAEAITMHLELMHESGEKIPPPRQSMEITIDPDAGEEFYSWVDVLVPSTAPATPRTQTAAPAGAAESSKANPGEHP